mmetsp:Transcript_60806/g.83482  ORF Transcript_60806/g.83482 Transcript_60806/m.83482 type:complete len:125 (+) Transcript_60806:168-542(+)
MSRSRRRMQPKPSALGGMRLPRSGTSQRGSRSSPSSQHGTPTLVPNFERAVATGRAMREDDDFFDPMSMRGIGWDDILDGRGAAESRVYENAISKYQAYVAANGSNDTAADYFNGLIKESGLAD